VQDTFGWFFIAVVAALLGVAVFLGVSRFGRIKLGPDDSTPDYSTGAWFAMLFSAGMGIGLVFWGVAEPIYIAGAPPVAEAADRGRNQEAMNFVFHHWGFSPWAIYAIIGLGLAYFGFRLELPMTIRSLFHPLLGDRVHGPLGNAIDVLAVVATLFGIATSLGLGAMQVAAGLEPGLRLGPRGPRPAALIAVITAFATISVVLGLDRASSGCRRSTSWRRSRWPSRSSLRSADAVPAVRLRREHRDLHPEHLQHAGVHRHLRRRAASDFLDDWTIFYWAWWISWSPFVGMFIARVSRGRTIREFVGGVLLAPTLASFAWFTIFGNTALVDPGRRRGQRARRGRGDVRLSRTSGCRPGS
jgi:choline/glycine/proline betaine transport protein